MIARWISNLCLNHTEDEIMKIIEKTDPNITLEFIQDCSKLKTHSHELAHDELFNSSLRYPTDGPTHKSYPLVDPVKGLPRIEWKYCAQRILHPVLSHFNGQTLKCGHYKNYKYHVW